MTSTKFSSRGFDLSCQIMNLNEVQLNNRLYSRSLIENKVIPFAHDLLGELNPIS